MNQSRDADPSLLPWILLGGSSGLLASAALLGLVVWGTLPPSPAPALVAATPKPGGPVVPVPPDLIPQPAPEDPARPLELIGAVFREGHPLAFTPDSRRIAAPLAVGSHQGVGLFDVGTGQRVGALQQHTGILWSLAFSPDGGLLVSASDDRLVKVWDVAAGKERATLPHGHQVRSVAFAPDGKTFASASDDRVLRFWDAATCQEVRAERNLNWGVHCLAFAPTGNRLGTVQGDFAVQLWDAATGKVDSTVQAARGRPYDPAGWGIAFSPDGSRLAVAERSGVWKVWDLSKQQEPTTTRVGHRPVWDIAFAPDNRTLVTAHGDGTVRLWDAATCRERVVVQAGNAETWCVTISPDGKYLAAGNTDGKVRVWALARLLSLAER